MMHKIQCETSQEKPPFWTHNGLKRLGHLIKTSLECRGISQNEAAQRITKTTGFYITKGGLNKVLNATTKMPEFNTLVAIAASGLVTDDSGHTLSIYDFIDIASESSIVIRGIDMDTLIRLIEQEQARRNITLPELASECGLDHKNLLEIMQGRETEDFEGDLILLSAILTNPQTGMRFGNPDDLADFCQIKIPAQNLGQESHLNSNLNGLCQ